MYVCVKYADEFITAIITIPLLPFAVYFWYNFCYSMLFFFLFFFCLPISLKTLTHTHFQTLPFCDCYEMWQLECTGCDAIFFQNRNNCNLLYKHGLKLFERSQHPSKSVVDSDLIRENCNYKRENQRHLTSRIRRLRTCSEKIKFDFKVKRKVLS